MSFGGIVASGRVRGGSIDPRGAAATPLAGRPGGGILPRMSDPTRPGMGLARAAALLFTAGFSLAAAALVAGFLAGGRVAAALAGAVALGAGAAGAADEGLADGDELLVLVVELPVSLRHAPGGRRVPLQRLQPRLLLRLRQVEPVLQQQDALVHQHPLEAHDLGLRGLEGAAADAARDAVEDRRGVPGAEEHADPPLRRQRAPEAPHRRMRLFLLGRQAEAVHLDEGRVHPFGQRVDRLAFARALDAGDQDQHREARIVLQRELRGEQRLAQLRLLAPALLLADAVVEFGGVEHGLPRRGGIRASRPRLRAACNGGVTARSGAGLPS
jgi:hypothetical protein